MKIKNLHFLFFLLIFSAFCFHVEIALAQPTNDNCASATTLIVNADCSTGNTQNGTLQVGEETTYLGTVDQTIWYKFQATATSMSVFIIGNSGNRCYSGSIVWDGAGGCFPTGTDSLSTISRTAADLSQKHELSGLTVGTWYYVQIGYDAGGPCGTSGTYCVSVYDDEVSTDACADAIEISEGQEFTVSNIGATSDKSLCSGSTENNIWFKWTVPADWTVGDTAFVHLYDQQCDFSYGMQLSVFQQSSCGLIPNPATTTDCEFYANTQTTSDIYYSWIPAAGEIYYFDLDGYGGTSCVFNFMVSPFKCLTITGFTIANASCGGSDGSVFVDVSNGAVPFTFLWTPAFTVTSDDTSSTNNNLPAGSYNVLITDNDGCQISQDVTVAGPVDASFTFTGEYCLNLTPNVNFTNTGSPPAATHEWDFTASATPLTSLAENPAGVTWSSVGTKSVRHIATLGACKDTVFKDVTIVDCTWGLVVNAGLNFSICDTLTDSLDGDYSGAAGGTPTYYINDNFDSYADNAAFTSSWTVFESNADQQANLSTAQYVSALKSINLYCAAAAGGSKYAKMEKTFTAITSGTAECNSRTSGGYFSPLVLMSGTVFKAQIYFKYDGSIYFYNGTSTALRTYTADTWYNIKITFDAAANTCEVFIDGVSEYTGTLANASYTTINTFKSQTDNAATFQAYVDDVKVYSIVGGGTPVWTAIAPASTAWLSSTTILSPIFTPPNVGTATVYQYILTVTDGVGSRADTVDIVVSNCCALIIDTINVAGIVADTLGNISFSLCDLTSVTFTGVYLYPSGGVTIRWSGANLNRLNDTTIISPVFTPTSAGNYFYTLKVTDGCWSAYYDIAIKVDSATASAAGFTVNNASQALTGNSFDFVNTGTDSVTYSWNFGDGSGTSTNEDPTYSYSSVGTFEVMQCVTIGGLCPAAICDSMNVTVTLDPCSDATRVYYRSFQTGNWENVDTWEVSCDGATGWVRLNTLITQDIPSYAKQTIVIRNTHTVTITASVTIDQTTIDVGGILIYGDNAGSTLNLNNGSGTDLIINGTFIDSGPNNIGW